ncbi:cyclase family protein [Nocardioides sp. LMS-CY]|uniref:cyclase family protein n=1 Tax=Nocardioides sp. (strain LMS-CY) TaxID=2840457 RepID=UPI001C0016D4|nr:cyclase family protein [Nocardioides sp. LMS-CY]QWF20742.1 cyclase family protein [Nocardioides sp. LMS-CY]
MCGPEIITDEVRKKIAAHAARFREVTRSPFGADDEIGMLNLLSPEAARRAVARADAGAAIDLSVDLFMGMPSWTKAGDPPFQQWMTHTPGGTVLDDLTGAGRVQNELVAYSGDAMSMYTHTGTHIDTLNHFGYRGEIWNGFSAEQHLSSRHWLKCGADKMPPIIGRGVLFDVAALHAVEMLPDNYGIGAADLRGCLQRQGVTFNPGDIALVRTGRMSQWPDPRRYIDNSPGLNLEGARWLAEAGASVIGGDNSALEQMPADDEENWQVVHTYLLGEAGVPMMELVDCQQLSADGLFEFAFVGACLKIRGATGAPMRPLAMPFTA